MLRKPRYEKNMDTYAVRFKKLRRHDHVVDLNEVFILEGRPYFVYEDLRCSLRHIASLPQKLSAFEIANVCKDVRVQLAPIKGLTGGGSRR